MARFVGVETDDLRPVYICASNNCEIIRRYFKDVVIFVKFDCQIFTDATGNFCGILESNKMTTERNSYGINSVTFLVSPTRSVKSFVESLSFGFSELTKSRIYLSHETLFYAVRRSDAQFCFQGLRCSNLLNVRDIILAVRKS